MNSILISIVVPVYKVERYLPRCIESILRQTYTNFELILVDDGTPDRSGIICDRYAEKDSRIKVIHKENGGVSSARNAGIDIAQGEWITFIDSDDWASIDYLQTLTNQITEGAELSVGKIQWRGLNIHCSELAQKEIVLASSPIDDVTSITKHQEFLGPYAKLFKRTIIEKYKIRYPVDISIGEDTIFVNRYLKHCKKICIASKEIYFYNKLNDISLTKKYVATAKIAKWKEVYLKSYEELWIAYEISEKIQRSILSKIAYSLYTFHVKSYVKYSHEYNEDDLRKINESFKKWLLLDNEWCVLKEERALFDAIIENQTKTICKILKKKPSICIRLNHYLHIWAVKILKNKIELNRDGLILLDV